MSARRLVVVGDALLDRDVEGWVERLCPDAPVPVVDEERRISRPGGAGLAAALAAADGYRVTLVTALAEDPAGRELAALLGESRVEVVDLGSKGATPEKVRILTGGRSLLRVDRGGRSPGAVGAVSEAVRRALASAGAVLVADYGRGISGQPVLRDALADTARNTPVVWDPHPRGTKPVPGVRLVTPNRDEAARLVPGTDGDGISVAERALALAGRWQAEVAVTLGAGGAVLADGNGTVLNVPAPSISDGDPCGAGDRFASRAAALLAGGASTIEAVSGAVLAASNFVAAGGAAEMGFREEEPAPGTDPNEAEEVVARVRATGGTVVATGGCFDLLHAGHVRTLEAARVLGDCLVVCLNSDSSVRRIKGADRPLVPEEDRVAVLEALACVDAVVTFDEDTPEAVLERLRPDIFAKGADYAISELPEVRLLERWGGRIEILPYVAGRSTTRLIREAAIRSAIEERS